MRAYHSMTAEEVLAELKTGELGLTQEEAAKRLEAVGENALQDKKKGSVIKLFFCAV